MRIFQIFAIVILVSSGILAVMFPRELVVPHARYGSGSAAVPLSTLEFVSKTGCRNYGFLAIATGVFMAWGALDGSYVPFADRRIAKSIVSTKKVLETDYGLKDRCTIAQVEVAVRDAKVSCRHLPYLCAAFMGRDEFDQLRANMPDVDWDKIEDRVSKIAYELPYKELNGSHFHESWIPTVDQ